MRKDEYKIIKKRKDVEEREKTKKGEKKRIEIAEKNIKRNDGKTTGNDEMELDEEDIEGDFDQKMK